MQILSNQDVPALNLQPMTAQEFEVWREESVRSYAEEKTRAGQFPASRALELSRQSFAALLPAGRDTPGHHLFSARRPGSEVLVGSVWLNIQPPPESSAYIYDIVVAESARGQGMGRALLARAEEFARTNGATSIGLNVFGHNQVARRLYETSGYFVTSMNMRKTLA